MAFFFIAELPASAAGLLPIDDHTASDTLISPGVSGNTPELFGNYAHIWTLDAETQVIQYYGDFSMHIGARRLSSRDAVVWMSRRSGSEGNYYHFEVYLAERARVQDAAGTITSGPRLLVTFDTRSPAIIERDLGTTESSSSTSLYQEAERVRSRIAAGQPVGAEPGGLEVQDVTAPRRPEPPQARPIVRYRADEEVIDTQARLVSATGNVYVSRGLVDSDDYLDIRADAAVLFLTRSAESGSAAEPDRRPPRQATPPSTTQPFPVGADEPDTLGVPAVGEQGMAGLGEGIGSEIAGVYLRGDVVLTRGDRMIRAAELYYDFEHDRALMLDAVMRALAPGGQLPIYVRAEQVRQLSSTEYQARQAIVSTSEFHTPHVALGAEEIRLIDLTPRDESGQVAGLQSGRFTVRDATVKVEGLPVAYWPYGTGDFRTGESPLQSLRLGYSDGFGAAVETQWHMFNLLGIEPVEEVDATLRLDYFSQRGPGVGTDIDYETDSSYGLFRGYYLDDHGEDSLGPFRDGEPDTDNRGRATVRHRELLGDGWEFTLEASYLSDPNFLEEYFNAEFEEGKEQESLLYLKKQEDNWAFTSLLQYRLLDFTAQTEHLPEFGFHLVGEPVGGVANYYNETHAGIARYRPDDRRLYDRNRYIDNTSATDSTIRGDTRNEIDFPLRVGDANVVPYASSHAGYWDGSVGGDGGRDRLFGSLGVRTGTTLWKLFQDVRSELFDLNGIRHVVKPESTAWFSGSNTDSRHLTPFAEGVETIDDFYGASLALRQRWQTKRGGPGQWRVVDWIVFDVEFNLFGHAPGTDKDIGRFDESRPENSTARNHARTDFLYRISDTTAVLSDTNWDLTDGNLDLFNLSYAVERTPRLAYFVGYRRIGDTGSDLVGAGFTYEINEKHRLAVRSYYDIRESSLEQLDVTLIRKWPRWNSAFTFALDEIDDNVSVGMALWPEGAPQIAIGNRRYARLGSATGIRPED